MMRCEQRRPSFSDAIAELTAGRMAEQQRVKYTLRQWVDAHICEIDKAVAVGVPWDSIYTAALPELPEPISFAHFLSEAFARAK